MDDHTQLLARNAFVNADLQSAKTMCFRFSQELLGLMIDMRMHQARQQILPRCSYRRTAYSRNRALQQSRGWYEDSLGTKTIDMYAKIAVGSWDSSPGGPHVERIIKMNGAKRGL